MLRNRPDNIYGENIFWAISSSVSGSDPVEAWYKEIHDYNFEQAESQSKTRHFTQVIWKNSSQLGVGIAKCKNGSTIVVANYDPSGNCKTQYSTNVKQSRSSKEKLNITQSSCSEKQQICDSVFNTFQMECLQAHNFYRQAHKVADLVLTKDMCKFAQQWANVMPF